MVTAPVDVAAGAVTGAGSQVLGAGGGPVSDIDRILAKHPDAANSDELSALRQSLMEQGIADPGSAAPGKAPNEFDRHAKRSRRLRADRPTLDRPHATGTQHGPPQRVEPKPFATARTSSIKPEVRRWYDTAVKPVRIAPKDSDRRADRGTR